MQKSLWTHEFKPSKPLHTKKKLRNYYEKMKKNCQSLYEVYLLLRCRGNKLWSGNCSSPDKYPLLFPVAHFPEQTDC